MWNKERKYFSLFPVVKGRIMLRIREMARPKASIKKESMCFFCKKKRHVKKDCAKHKAWLEKKDTYFSFVCYESNFTNVNHNT